MTLSRTTRGVFFENIILNLQLSHGLQQLVPLPLAVAFLVWPFKLLSGALQQLPLPLGYLARAHNRTSVPTLGASSTP